jgi:hypothetical protein
LEKRVMKKNGMKVIDKYKKEYIRGEGKRIREL